MENQPREIRVEFRRDPGFVLEIEGTPENPFVFEDAAFEDPARVAEEAVRRVLSIPADMPLKLTITTDDADLFRDTDDTVKWSGD